jgi:hypothetical protein
MQNNGIAQGQVAEVRGFADQLPRRPDHPEDPANRRITLIVAPSALRAISKAPEQTPSAEPILQRRAVKGSIVDTNKRD